MTTPQDIITMARDIVNDSATPYRQSDAELLRYFNEGIKEISGLRIDLFSSIGDMVCTAGQSEQTLTFYDAQGIVQVLCIHGGAALTQFDIQTMNAFMPAWRAETPAAATQWARMAGDPLRFFVYPPAPATPQTLDIMYVRNPISLAITDTIAEIPQSLHPALVDYIVYRTESKDDEHVNSGRAASHQQAFIAKVKGA